MFSPTTDIPPAPPSWRVAVWHAVDRAVAFATLDAYGLPAPRAAVDAPGARADCEPLRAPRRPRRPGPAHPIQHCVTPLEAPARRHQQAQLPRLSSPARQHGHR